MDKLEVVRKKVDGLISQMCPEKQRGYYVHLYGVSHFAAMLAIRRGLDPVLASVCGMLHDIYQVTAGKIDDHALHGSVEAKAIIESTGLFSADEIDIITAAILNHSYKTDIHLPYDELLKDADVLSHCMYNPAVPIVDWEQKRYDSLLVELGANT